MLNVCFRNKNHSVNKIVAVLQVWLCWLVAWQPKSQGTLYHTQVVVNVYSRVVH